MHLGMKLMIITINSHMVVGSRDGDVTQGQYRVLLPDGRIQVSV